MRLARQILFVSPLLAVATPAQVPWYQSPINGHLYGMSPPMSWQEAEAFAASFGGHLAAIRDQAEQSWLTQRFGVQDLWIGVTDVEVDGRFVRANGQPSGYAPWAPGMPIGNPGANRVYMSEPGWISAPGGLRRPGIVEVPELAAYIPFGVGCAGSAGIPILGAAAGRRPRIGSTFTVQLSNLPTGPDAGNAFILFGWSNTVAGSIPLPFDLSPLGLVGCTGFVSPDATTLLSPMGSSAVQVPVDIPNLPRLLGLTFYNQGVVEESGINSFGAVLTNAAEAVVGGPSIFTTGFGPRLTSPQGIAVGATHAFVADSGLPSSIFAVDLTTGDRSLVSNPPTYGTGPSIGRPLALDLLGERAFGVSPADAAVFELDVLTGQRTVLSDPVTGGGPALSSPVGIAVDGNRLLVTDSDLAAVVEVDPSTGDRSIVSDAGKGGGVTLQFPVGITVDGIRALVVDNILSAVIAVDLATGDRTDVSSAFTGSGQLLRLPDSIAVEGDRALVTDRGLEAIVAVDLGTGDRSIMSDASSGIGPAFFRPYGIAVVGSRALVTDMELGAVIAVDLQTGNRKLLSN